MQPVLEDVANLQNANMMSCNRLQNSVQVAATMEATRPNALPVNNEIQAFQQNTIQIRTDL